MTMLDEAEALLPGMVSLRRAIHAEPELGLHNPRTAARIRETLADLPLEWREGPSTSGLVATLKGGANGRTVLLRGDTDALPMQEDTGLPFASIIKGAMHACGHDSHVAMLAGAARLLSARRAQLAGTVIFMFQPGEEGHHGARYMLEDGLLDPLPDAAFALHVMPNAPHGLVSGKAGPLMASADKIRITITGKGGHASMPHDALDPVPIACEIVLAIQSWVTRNVPIADPAVVTIAEMKAGSTDNVIPESAMLFGTIRTLSPQRRSAVQQGLKRLAEGIAQAHGASAHVAFTPGFPVTVCDGRAVEFGERTVKALLGAEGWVTLTSPVMGAEDFAYVLEKVPGAMFFLGASHEGDDWRQCCALHSNRMMLDESVMARGAAVHAALAERFLAEGFAA
ncbi:M20 metallopeptidase family protein [Sandaracinobacteroides sp. A072]|uniref:M20 metallopeptidase family protein n=1 Tax=Sandaracinobacteroides sp. A072 TaxID=3461146 RepID=UPI004042DD5B